ncbi:MAG: FAD-dependent oxidoreductase [Dehalococcoidia bacterium]
MTLKQIQAQIYGGEKCWSSIVKLAPCEAACPLNMRVSDYASAIGRERFSEAYAVMREATPLVAVCGYVCHHPCEASCIRGQVDEPIAIRALKRFVADQVLSGGLGKPAPTESYRSEKVAIIGSGPAGLAAAESLTRRGFGVTIFEAMPVAGGMLAAGIAEFVLPRKVLEAEIGLIQGLGVEIRTGTTIASVEDLLGQGYAAVFLAVGAHRSVKLDLPGFDMEGVISALPLLQEANLGKGTKLQGRVLVIGGGNVGVSAARVAARLGATEVSIVYRRTRAEMPAFAWEVQEAEEEGVKIHCSLAPQRVIARDGRAGGVTLAPVKSMGVDKEGGATPQLAEGPEQTMDADTVIVAIGQAPALPSLPGMDIAPNGVVVVDPYSLATSVPGVFAGGDVVVGAGAGTVVEAIAAGKRAASSIDSYLRGLEPDESPQAAAWEVAEDMVPRFVEKRSRRPEPLLPRAERTRSSQVVEMAYSRKDAVEEARRCLNCSMCGNCMFDHIQMCHETGTRLL